MKTYVGRPILGAILGGLGALVLVLILMFGAIVPPTRFVVWGLCGLGILVGSLMLTLVLKSVRFISILVVALAMLVWSGLGFSAHNANGDLSGGCTLAGLSFDEAGEPLDAATPQQTSVADPFVIAPYGTIDWTGNTPGAFEGWGGWLAVDFAGFAIRVWDGGHDNSGLDPDEGGTIDVGSYVEDIEDTTKVELAGVLHLFGNITAPDGACDMDAYLELPSDGLFSGPVLIVLWVLLAIIAIILIVLMIGVCRARKAVTAAAPLGGAAAAAAATAQALDAADARARDAADSPVRDAGDVTADNVVSATPEAAAPAPTKGGATKPAAKKPAAKKKSPPSKN